MKYFKSDEAFSLSNPYDNDVFIRLRTNMKLYEGSQIVMGTNVLLVKTLTFFFGKSEIFLKSIFGANLGEEL